MSGFYGRLEAKLGLNSTEFSTGLRRARQEATGFANEAAARVRSLTAGLRGMTLFGASIGAAAAGVRNVMREIARIGDEAQRAGLPVEDFQEFAHVATEARIPLDALTDGFKEMALRADEWVVTGSGPAAEAFARLGFEAGDLARRLETPSELFLEIIRRLERLPIAARVRIADEVFGGTAGERFMGLIDRGAASMERAMQRARDLGLVYSEETIRFAADIDARFNALANQLVHYGQRVVVGWAMIGQAAIDAVSDPASEIEQATRALEGEYATLSVEARGAAYDMQGLADVARDLGDAGFQRAFGAIAEALEVVADEFDAGRISGEQFRNSLGSVLDLAGRALGAVTSIDDVSLENAGSVVDGLRDRLQALAGQALATARAVAEATITPATQAESFWDTEESRFSTLNRLAPTRSPRPQPAPVEGAPAYGGTTGSRGSGGRASDTGYAAAVTEIRARTEALLAEAAALAEAASSGMAYGEAAEYAAVRAEMLAEAQAEGRQVTPELRAEIDAMARAYVAAGQGVETLREGLERAHEAGLRGAEAITDIFMAATQGGDSARNAVMRLILEMARLEAMRAFEGLLGGGGGGILGAIGSLLGRNARGTASWRGGLSLVGEEGPEILNLPTGTSVTPALATARMLREGAAGGGVTGRMQIALAPGLVASMLDESARQSVAITQTAVEELAGAMPAVIARHLRDPRLL